MAHVLAAHVCTDHFYMTCSCGFMSSCEWDARILFAQHDQWVKLAAEEAS